MASIRQVRRLYGEMAEPKELVVIEGADHVFDGQASLVGEAIEDLLGDFEERVHEGAKDPKHVRDNSWTRSADVLRADFRGLRSFVISSRTLCRTQ